MSTQETQAALYPRFECNEPIVDIIRGIYPDPKIMDGFEKGYRGVRDAKSLPQACAYGLNPVTMMRLPDEVIRKLCRRQQAYANMMIYYKHTHENEVFGQPQKRDIDYSNDEPMVKESRGLDSTEKGGTMVCHHDTLDILEDTIVDDNKSNNNQPTTPPEIPQGAAVYYNCTFNTYMP